MVLIAQAPPPPADAPPADVPAADMPAAETPAVATPASPTPASPTPASPTPAGPTPASPTPAGPTPALATPAPTWLPRGTADLQVLDKVSTRSYPLTVPVGQAGAFGPLTIAVRFCLVHPPDEAADATAFLDVTDSTPGAPAFHGWVIRSAPAVSAMQHPVYDVRLVGCR